MRAVLLLAIVAAACKETRTVRLTFTSGNRVPLSVRCFDDSGVRLARRAVEGRTMRFSVIVDFIGLGGSVPSCRPGDIIASCEEHSCAPLAAAPRRCYELERAIPLGDETTLPLLAAELLRELADQGPIAEDAPHEPLIIRATVVHQPCDALPGTTPPDPAELVGCATSCPLQLDGIDGEVSLQLDANSERCEASVIACAGLTP